MSDTFVTRLKFASNHTWTFRRGEIVSFLDSGVGGSQAPEVSYGLITKSVDLTVDDRAQQVEPNRMRQRAQHFRRCLKIDRGDRLRHAPVPSARVV